MTIFAWILKTSWPKVGVFFGGEGVKWRRGGAILTQTNSFLLLEVLTSLQVLVKIDQELRP